MKANAKFLSVLTLAIFILSALPLESVFAEGKIAYVDLASVFDGYQKTKDYDVKLEGTQKEKQKEIDKKVEEIKGLQDKLDLLAEKEKQSKQEEIDKKTKELQEFQQNAEIGLREERNEKLKEVLQDIQDVVEGIAKEKGYDYILNDRVLLYGNETLNISTEVSNKLNENYKNKNKKN